MPSDLSAWKGTVKTYMKVIGDCLSSHHLFCVGGVVVTAVIVIGNNGVLTVLLWVPTLLLHTAK